MSEEHYVVDLLRDLKRPFCHKLEPSYVNRRGNVCHTDTIGTRSLFANIRLGLFQEVDDSIIMVMEYRKTPTIPKSRYKHPSCPVSCFSWEIQPPPRPAHCLLLPKHNPPQSEDAQPSAYPALTPRRLRRRHHHHTLHRNRNKPIHQHPASSSLELTKPIVRRPPRRPPTKRASNPSPSTKTSLAPTSASTSPGPANDTVATGVLPHSKPDQALLGRLQPAP